MLLLRTDDSCRNAPQPADRSSGVARQPRRVRFLSRSDQGARERSVEPTRDGGHSLVTKLPECGRWLVVLEDAVPGIVLVKHHPDRSIERRREPMPRHERGGDRIADIVLERVTRFAGDL